MSTTYRVALESLLRRGDLPQPAPASPETTRRVEKMEAVAIADTRDFSKQGPPAILVGMDVFDAGYSTQVDTVELEGAEQDGGHHESRHPGARVLVMVHMQRVVPTQGFGRPVRGREGRTFLIIISTRGSGCRPRLPWPWHFAGVTSRPGALMDGMGQTNRQVVVVAGSGSGELGSARTGMGWANCNWYP